MSLSMSKIQREAFLAGLHVAVIGIAEEGHGPLTVPIWYSYEPGGVVRFVTGGGSRKAALLRKAGRLSLCVQTETAPYQYVSIEGPVTLGEPDFERDFRAMAHRYLGAKMGDKYLRMTAGERSTSILVTVVPERWMTVDYSRMAV